MGLAPLPACLRCTAFSFLVTPHNVGFAAFVGSAVAFIVPAHLAIGLAFVGVGILVFAQPHRAVRARRLPVISPVWLRTMLATGLVLVATLAWGIATGHGTPMGGGSSPSGGPASIVSSGTVVSPFNASGANPSQSPLSELGSSSPFDRWFLLRKQEPLRGDIFVSDPRVALAAGAIGWGAGSAISRCSTCISLASRCSRRRSRPGLRIVWERLRTAQYRWLAVGLVVLCLFQLELGVLGGIIRLQGFGPAKDESIPVAILAAINQLPAGAKLAYSCGPFDEIASGTPQLLSIDAHTGRRVIPMCFVAEYPNRLLGAEQSEQASQFFRGAPQASLYPDAFAHPSSATVAAFMKAHGIDYIYAAPGKPNSLVDDAIQVATVGDGDPKVP